MNYHEADFRIDKNKSDKKYFLQELLKVFPRG